MIEPVFEVELSDDVTTRMSASLSGELTPKKIVCLLQVYDRPETQNSIRQICDTLIRTAGVRLLTGEGARGEVDLFGSDMQVISRISSGQLAAARAHNGMVTLFGVDDLTVADRSNEARNRLIARTAPRERLFDAVRERIIGACKRLYPAPLADYRISALSMHARPLSSLSRELELLREAASQANVDFRAFRHVSTFLRCLATESDLDNDVIQRENREFIGRVNSKVFGWFRRTGPNTYNVDLKEADPFVNFWLDSTGQTAEDFNEQFRIGGADRVLLACKNWYQQWFDSAKRPENAFSNHKFIESLMRMALWTHIPYFDLESFRRRIAYERDASSIFPLGLRDEMFDLAAAIARACGPAAEALFELEEDLDLFYRALRTSLPSSEADLENLGGAKLRDRVEQLCKLAEAPLPQDISNAVDEVAGVMETAGEFLTCSKQRSKIMIDGTLEVMRQRCQEQAIVVIGGFHQRIVSWELEQRKNISWSVLLPTVDISNRESFFLS